MVLIEIQIDSILSVLNAHTIVFEFLRDRATCFVRIYNFQRNIPSRL